MSTTRRTFASGLAGYMAYPFLAHAAGSSWPQRPITLVVPFPAGGVTDNQARILVKLLTEDLGQPVVIDNKAGAGGSIGSDYVARQVPDGYTFILGTQGSHAANGALYKKLPYDPVRDFVPVHGLVEWIPLLAVNPDRPYKTIGEFVAYAKANPGAIRLASAGVGSGGHLTGALLQQAAGIQLLHVPYKGAAPALNDVFAGHADAYFDYPVALQQPVQAGRLRALAFMGHTRAGAMPTVPTIVEAGYPAAENIGWSVLYMPAKTPPTIVARMADAVEKAMKDPAMGGYTADLGSALMVGMRGARLEQYLSKETVRWREIVQKSGATLD